ncbi:MAG: hypothetical protein R3A78_03665 [Polyangiales bacterium]|nr:hypothetical protein [Myxococcales bacterium]
MRTKEDIESYLLRSGLSAREVAPSLWVVDEPGAGEHIVVTLADPVVVFRVKVMALAEVKAKDKLFETLLALNATDMVHGAYGIAEGAVVLTCTLRLEHLDYSEFQGTLDDFSLALAKHYDLLAVHRTKRSS